MYFNGKKNHLIFPKLNFTPNSLGCYGLKFYEYLILLQGAEQIQDEMSDSSESLIDVVHGYGSQSLINLMLTGRAVGHVWDNEQDVGGLSKYSCYINFSVIRVNLSLL